MTDTITQKNKITWQLLKMSMFIRGYNLNAKIIIYTFVYNTTASNIQCTMYMCFSANLDFSDLIFAYMRPYGILTAYFA